MPEQSSQNDDESKKRKERKEDKKKKKKRSKEGKKERRIEVDQGPAYGQRRLYLSTQVVHLCFSRLLLGPPASCFI